MKEKSGGWALEGKREGGMEGGIGGGSFFHTRSGGEILRKEYPLARMNVGLER